MKLFQTLRVNLKKEWGYFKTKWKVALTLQSELSYERVYSMGIKLATTDDPDHNCNY